MRLVVVQLAVVICWLISGIALGYLGVLVSSHIPVFLLGFIFGVVAAFVHCVLLALGFHVHFVVVGCIVTLIAGSITLLWAPMVIWPHALLSYFVFGTLQYAVLERQFAGKVGPVDLQY